jgi:hypothetical protein
MGGRSSTMPEARAQLADLSARADCLSRFIVTPGELAELRQAIATEAEHSTQVAEEALALAARRHTLTTRNATLRREAAALKEALAAQRGWGAQPRATAPPRAIAEGADSAAAAVGEAFLRSAPEVADMNQYWYSSTTIETIVAELGAAAASAGGAAAGLRVACLSTPSVYFSLPEASPARAGSIAFDYDKQWEGHPNYRYFDFRDPTGTIEPALRHSFDYCVVDPPFITRDVWTKYAEAIRLCLKPGAGAGRVILTTVGENEAMLRTVLGAELGASLRKTTFMPAMQKPWYGFGLPYQYSLYVNYDLRPESGLNRWNHEVPEEFKEPNALRMPDETAGGVPTGGGGGGGDGGAERAIGGSGGLSFEEMLEREMAKEAEAAAEAAAARDARLAGAGR